MNAMRALLEKEAAADLTVVVATVTTEEVQEAFRKCGLTIGTLEDAWLNFGEVDPKTTAEVMMTMQSLKEALAAGETVPGATLALRTKIQGLWLTEEEKAGESAKDARKREKRERKFALAVAKRLDEMR